MKLLLIVITFMAAALSLHAEEWTEASVKALSQEAYTAKEKELMQAISDARRDLSDFHRKLMKTGEAEASRGDSTAARIKKLEINIKIVELFAPLHKAELQHQTFLQFRSPTEERGKKIEAMTISLRLRPKLLGLLNRELDQLKKQLEEENKAQ